MPFRCDVPQVPCRRVLITGIGLWTPLGSDRESTWRRLLAGDSAACWLSAPQWPGPGRLAGAPCSRPPECPDSGRDPVIALAQQVVGEAIRDSGLEPGVVSSSSTGVVFGTSKGGLQTASRLLAGESDRDSTGRLWHDVWPDAAARSIAATWGCEGPVLAPVAACATGLAACLRGIDLVRHGHCDVVVAGSSDASLQPAILGSFQRMGVLARAQDDPATSCRPFDRSRSGFVVGEGAGCLILESHDHAVARKAAWYAEWLGGRILADPAGLTRLDPQGLSLQRLLRDLSEMAAGVPDYINLHGTGTVANDRVESEAVRAVLGSRAGGIACSSLKGGLGHLLGAAGSVELAATVLAIRNRMVPPTVNLRDVDCELGLDFTPVQARSLGIERAWKLSLGFGGHLSAACVGRLAGPGDRTV